MQLVWDTSLPQTQKMVLLALADQANDQGIAWPHIGSLAKRCGITKRAVFEALAQLEEGQCLKRETHLGVDVNVQLKPSRWPGKRR